MRYSSLSLWVGELWFYHQGFRYCIFQALCFSGSYNLYHLHGFTFRTTENFSSFAYSFIFIRNVCEQRHAPSFLTVFALFFFLSEKEKNPLDNALLYSRWMIKSFFRPLWNRRSDVLVRIFREIFAHGCRWFIMA